MYNPQLTAKSLCLELAHIQLLVQKPHGVFKTRAVVAWCQYSGGGGGALVVL